MALEKIIEQPGQEISPGSNLDKAPKIEKPDRSGKIDQDRRAPERPPLTDKVQPINPISPQSSSFAWQQKRAQAIDDILSEGLHDIFMNMAPAQQQAFKNKGEETVVKINELLSKTKVQIGKIISLIRDWLKMVPGINQFFLEQEVKIKADKIIKLKDKL